MRLFWSSKNGTKVSDTKFVKWEGPATKIPEKIKPVGFVSEARLCHKHQMSATTNKFLFAEKNDTRKPEMFYITPACYNLKQARTRPGTEHYLSYRAQARADLYLHVHLL
jgi:hypothetical protein